ncbi:MAG: EVE domain-containing protein [archaeon]|nr:EVE domain-containing protein [archaeon]
MTQYWIWPVTEENWEIVKAKQIWATHNEKIRHKVLKGDMIIFYVTKSGCFQGIYKILNEWYITKDKVWSDETTEVKYPYQVKLEVHKLGKVEYKKLVPQLDFVVSKKGYRNYIMGSDGGPGNHGKPISEADYQRILAGMGIIRPPPEPKYKVGEILIHPKHGTVKVISISFRDGKWSYEVGKVPEEG